MTEAKNVMVDLFLSWGRMLSPSAATVGKKLLVDDKITVCAKQISLGCYM